MINYIPTKAHIPLRHKQIETYIHRKKTRALHSKLFKKVIFAFVFIS